MSEQRPSKELLPCPFCGSPARGPHLHQYDRAPGGYWWIECSGPDECCTVEGHGGDREAIARWNRRAASEPPASRYYGVPRDRPIWICSVCDGWNHVQDRFCTHTHAVTKEAPHDEHCDVNDPIIKGKPCNCRDRVPVEKPAVWTEEMIQDNKRVAAELQKKIKPGKELPDETKECQHIWVADGNSSQCVNCMKYESE